MKSKEICKGLTVQCGEDGHWLIFKSRSQVGMINIENVTHSALAQQVICGWIDEQLKVPKKPAMPLDNGPITYLTFGQCHVHEINGVVYDKDCVVVFHTDETTVRELAFKFFGEKWFTTYPGDKFGPENLRLFPRGFLDAPQQTDVEKDTDVLRRGVSDDM